MRSTATGSGAAAGSRSSARTSALGHGAVDFAGSGVVHMCGGMIAIAGGLCIGPRLGKYGPDGKPRPIPGHDIPMVMLGTFILALGWFGFNPGSTLAGTDNRIAIVAVNTMLAGAAASVGTLFTMYLVTGKPDPSMLCNGLLAGLVAITAPCAFVNTRARCILGFIAGVIVVFSVFFWERTAKIDDAVGAISVHGVCGCWGVLSVGLVRQRQLRGRLGWRAQAVQGWRVDDHQQRRRRGDAQEVRRR